MGCQLQLQPRNRGQYDQKQPWPHRVLQVPGGKSPHNVCRMYEKFSFQNKGLLKKDTAETYEKHVQII